MRPSHSLCMLYSAKKIIEGIRQAYELKETIGSRKEEPGGLEAKININDFLLFKALLAWTINWTWKLVIQCGRCKRFTRDFVGTLRILKIGKYYIEKGLKYLLRSMEVFVCIS